MEKLTCHICQSPIHPKVMSVHLKSHHNVEFYDYVCSHLDNFRPFGWAECLICKKVTRSYAKKGATCSRVCSNKLRESWTGEKSHRTGVKLSNETKNKIGDANRGNTTFLGKTHTTETKQRISDTRIKNGLSRGSNNPMFGKTHTIEALKKINEYRPMNKLEKMVADELDRLGVSYTFQFFITIDSTCKSYDFKIKDSDTIIEVDGDYWHGNPSTKSHWVNSDQVKTNDTIKDKMANERGYKVVHLWESDIKRDISVVSECLKDVVSHIYRR